MLTLPLCREAVLLEQHVSACIAQYTKQHVLSVDLTLKVERPSTRTYVFR